MEQPADLPDVGALTAAIAAGDADAFAVLYNARSGLVYAVVRRATGLSEPDCLDITQEAMLRMIRRMKVTGDPEALDAWLARVARTTAYDHLRAERRRRTRETAAARTRPESAASAQSRLAEIDEALVRCHAALAHLDADRAELLRHRFGRAMTLDALGRALGLKPGATDGRVARALRAAQEHGDADA